MGKHRKKHEWQAVFKEQQKSGLSIVKFCKHHAISTTNFYRARINLIGQSPSGSAFIKATVTPSNIELTAASSSQLLRLKTQHAEVILPSHCTSQFIIDILKGLHP